MFGRLLESFLLNITTTLYKESDNMNNRIYGYIYIKNQRLSLK